MAEKRQKYGRRFKKIVDFPNFLETSWKKTMKRKSKVYGQIYLHIFEFFLRLFRAKFDFLILS